MNLKETFRNIYKGMGHSVGRFPLTVLFLLGIAIQNGLMIENYNYDYTRLIFTFAVGAMLGVVGQMLYERFFTDIKERLITMGGTVLLTLGYYLIAGPENSYNLPISVKTSVAIFSLFIAFIWVPTLKNEKVPFHRSFLSAFKAFFTAAVFSFVLGLGISAIITAINILLFRVESEFYMHLINIVGVLFGPIYFLSMTPLFPNEHKQVDADIQPEPTTTLEHQFSVPRFLEILISYIVIPITVIYTVILVLYFLINMRGDFWTDNLLEPLLVSYAITVIIVYILASNLDNRFANTFRLVFPKVLVPIVLFQTIASVLKISEMGITHGRYYVILFGIFATITGLIFSFNQAKNNGLMAVVLLVLATISIIPPIDAFTVSKNNQIHLLEEKLEENDMLEGNDVIPKEDVPTEDQIVITKLTNYLENMGYTDDIDYLPEKYNPYEDFEKTFGFSMTYSDETYPGDEKIFESYYLVKDEKFVLPIENFDVVVHHSAYSSGSEEEPMNVTTDFQVNDADYHFEKIEEDNMYRWLIKDNNNQELITFDISQIYDEIKQRVSDEDVQRYSGELILEEATVLFGNDQVQVQVLVDSLEYTEEYMYGEFYFYIQIKE